MQKSIFHGFARGQAKVYLAAALVVSCLLMARPSAAQQPPAWQVNKQYAVGALVTYQANIYRCLQAHRSQADWNPVAAPALWAKQNVVTPSPTVTASPTPTPTASPTITPTPSPTPTGTPGTVRCVVNYAVTDQWSNGFTANVTVTNLTGVALNGWQLLWNYAGNQTVNSLWNGSFTQVGKTVKVSNVGWNASVAQNASFSLGFTASYSGSNAAPTAFTLNGVPCNTSAPPPTPTPTPTPSPTATPTATPTPSPTPLPSPSPTPGLGTGFVFAPYVDPLLWPTFPLTQTAQQIGVKNFSLGFVVARNTCEASWGGVIGMADNFLLDDINSLRALGGNAIVSFGGANGIELGQSCSNVTALQAQYQAVIDRYGLTHIDLDIEGGAIADAASIDRRNKALAGLQATTRAQGRTLVVSYTLPVLPTGLTHEGISLLQNAVANGVRLDRVNIMAMDYGSVANPYTMGQNAIDAANSLLAQMRPIFVGKTDAELRKMTGITPMIGLNDVSPEVFTLSDAQLLYNFATQNGIGSLSMWSMTRDQSCANGGTYVSPTCSGIAQVPWAFSNTFKAFTR